MISRQDCYDALFKLKNAGVDISAPLNAMMRESGVPRQVILFLRDNSPQFQFYRDIQKHQKALANSLLDYETLDDISKIITCSSFVTRAMIAVKYKNLDPSLLDDLNISEVSDAINYTLHSGDFSKLDNVLRKHSNSLKLFYESYNK